jgi:D-tyrosyl-tRNA(Tyr) deacylase
MLACTPKHRNSVQEAVREHVVKVLLQRVSRASVTVDGEIVGAIGRGLLLFVGVEQGDGSEEVRAAADKISGLRVFSDDEGKMNLAVGEVGGGLLVVSQFTLAGSLRKGRRPSFDGAAEPALAERLVDELASAFEGKGLPVERGRFAADMQVELLNDGPVTFLLELPFAPRR